jgi:hypothetical protein
MATQTEGDQSVQHCPGLGGYSLDVLDDDSRMSVTVVTSAGEQRPLDLWDTVTPQFSRLGPHAECSAAAHGRGRHFYWDDAVSRPQNFDGGGVRLSSIAAYLSANCCIMPLFARSRASVARR